jgi:hypothetical protein
MPEYQIHLDPQWQDRTAKVWIYQSHPQGTTVFYPEGDVIRTVDIKNGELFPKEPSLRLPNGMLQALVDAAMPQFPPSEALDRHLRDAIGVRDRLLTIVEKGQK